MSLINDALKKAQNLQARPAGTLSAFPRPTPPAEGSNPPASTLAASAPAAPSAAMVPPRKAKSPHSALIIAIAATVLLAGVGAIGYVVYALFFMGTPAEQTTAATTPPALVKPDKSPAPAATPAPAPVAESSAPTTSTPATTTASEPPAAPASAPALTSAPVVPSVVTTPAVAATLAAAPAPDPAEEEVVEERINHPKPNIQAWVDKITVSGIRPGDKPKALMNDRVFVIGDVVNRELGLQLLKISDRLLVFEDAEGNTYDYTF